MTLLHRALTLREATIADAALLRHWDEQPFIQIIDPAEEESHYRGNVANDLRAIDIWIGEADYLGQGFGPVHKDAAQVY